ncbi:transporter substrate-binding domain-containing protein [Mesorhizobium cantuariense]|uniref:Transporter substrate-binding domain-containing protein n=1 Tax=Mesorhizobium cantuariense TaxID=1300275 RepID=A0ABV7MFJ4_9HYPH
MKRALVLLTLAIAAIVRTAYAEPPKVVRIASDGESPPYAMMSPAGSLEGFEVDLMKVLCGEAGVQCTTEIVDFSGMIAGLTQGKYDIAVASMGITQKRLQVIDFSEPYGGDGNVWATSKGSSIAEMPGSGTTLDLSTPEAKAKIEEMRKLVKGKTLGAQTASISLNFLNTYFADVADIREYEKNEEINLDLASGRLDAAVNGRQFLKAAIDQGGEFSQIEIVGPLMKGDVFGPGIGFGFRKDSGELRLAFNKALHEAGKEGTMSKLFMKWFGEDQTPPALLK